MTRLIILLALIPTVVHAEPKMVIHVLNTHYVTPEVFAADLKDLDNTITQEQIDKQYLEFLDELEKIQEWQRVAFLGFVDAFNVKEVYVEGLTEKNHKGTLKFIETLKKYEKDKTPPESDFDRLVEAQNKIDLLELGAAGQLVITGQLKTILPADDSKVMEAANPLQSDGKIVFNKKAIEAREDAIINNLRKSDNKIVMVLLGRGHDLEDNIKRLMSKCRYRRVDYVSKSPKVMEAIRRRTKNEKTD